MILQRDVRTPPLQSERRLQGHRQEVCGLKWSTDHQLLASGGNDNTVQLLSPLDFTLSLCKNTAYLQLLTQSLAISATGVESLFTQPSADVHGPPGRSQSHRLVPPPTRPAGLRGWNSGSLYPILEHLNLTATAVHGYWVSGLQPGLVQTCQ